MQGTSTRDVKGRTKKRQRKRPWKRDDHQIYNPKETGTGTRRREERDRVKRLDLRGYQTTSDLHPLGRVVHDGRHERHTVGPTLVDHRGGPRGTSVTGDPQTLQLGNVSSRPLQGH